MKITILFFSTNRLEFLIPSLDSFFKFVDFHNYECYSVMIDDYPKDRDDEIFKNIQQKYAIDKLILHDKNEGYSKTWTEAWNLIPTDTDYIFHQEDDFTYHTKIHIPNLIKIFEKRNSLYQIVLKRQVWYEPPDSDLIYRMENNIWKTTEEKINIDGVDHYITTQKNIFNANPCIYPYFITQLDYKNNIQEHMIVKNILSRCPDMYGCFYGKKLDPPLVTHIGHFTQGKRVLPGEPAYEQYKLYDPNKKYDAKKWLTEYDENKETNHTYMLKLKNILQKNELNDKISHLKKLIETSSDFLEGYYYLMLEYQNQKQHLKAYTIGVSAGQKWRNKKDFINNEQKNIYEYLFDLNFALNAYYAEFYNEAFMINKRLLNRFPKHKNIQSNQVFYDQKFDNLAIENNILSNHFTLNKPKIIVIDNFYKDPDRVRNFALKQKFNVVGNFPGKRTVPFKEPYHKEMFEKILGKKIKYWPGDYNGCFQVVTENLKSWIHRDLTEYSAIIFLNPEPKISTGGTNLYIHKSTKLLLANNKNDEKILSNDSNNLNAWEKTDTLGNLYNRCILFQGKHNHKSNEYFGDNLYNGRLFQIFFFDT